METLFGLFEAANWIGEILSRDEDKGKELSDLAFNVQSVTQSIQTFSDNLPQEDRDYVFNSNQVFPELARVLNSAKRVLEKFSPPAIENGQQAKPQANNGFRGMLTSGMKQGSRTLQEGLEAISSKVGGRASDLLRLPEDELGLIRQANIDIRSLMPQLQLAIQAVAIRGSLTGTKRPAETALESDQDKRLRTLADGEVSGQAAQAGQAGQALPLQSEVKRPLLELKLVSDATYAQDMDFPRITTMDLRTTAALSSTSLESDSSPGDRVCRLVMGRIELHNKKVSFEVPTPGKPTSISRFISRDFMQMDVPDVPGPTQGTQGTVDMATLALDYWDDSQETVESSSLAHVSGLGNLGVHIRRKGETRWRFNARHEKVEVMEGDRLALVLESPPGSVKQAPNEDLEAEQAVCILGCELKRP
ncbi:unnamed protein product [Cladocopium goreaui]|uniref:Uncharacterized protein n=1 Tax=Cladocopium goreaui TaxID=2562237 RepID=A0A9P1G8X0_9DINO|nr:unnamed protein product [Cladocopium goreaui]